MKTLAWQYNEMKQVGKDYGDPAIAGRYDSCHSQFRDPDRDSEIILDALRVPAGGAVIDIGAGTGTFAIHAARRCAMVYAVDVSQAMLAHARQKAQNANLSNIAFCHGGFLTYKHRDAPVDAIVTSAAFHHLPDFWKAIALDRMHGMLKAGGRLCIHDVIFSEVEPLRNIAQWIDELAEVGGQALREDTEMHIREEFSTFDWIMDGLLTRSGFQIKEKQIQKGVFGRYLCEKK